MLTAETGYRAIKLFTDFSVHDILCTLIIDRSDCNLVTEEDHLVRILKPLPRSDFKLTLREKWKESQNLCWTQN